MRVQHLLKRRAPIAAYVPTRVPRGFRYYHYENLGRSGFDLYFQCCGRVRPIGFDAGHVWPGTPCNQGTAMKVFWIDGVRVAWNSATTTSRRGVASGCATERTSCSPFLQAVTGARPGSSRKWSHPRGASGESRTLAQARPGLRRREDALGTGGAFRDGPNCLLRVLSCKRLLSRSLSFDALVFLLVPTSYVSFPQVRSHATCEG